MKQKPDGNKQKKSEWVKFFITGLIPTLIAGAALFLQLYETWHEHHGVRCNHTNTKWDGDLIKVRLSFENEGNKQESIIGASLYFPESDKNKGEPRYINNRWENVKYTSMVETNLKLMPNNQTDCTFKWPIKRADYAENPYG